MRKLALIGFFIVIDVPIVCVAWIAFTLCGALRGDLDGAWNDFMQRTSGMLKDRKRIWQKTG